MSLCKYPYRKTKQHFIHNAFTMQFIISSCKQNEVSEESELESIPSPTGTNASLPYLVTGANGNLYLSWVEQSGDMAILKYAMLNDNAFGQTETIASGTDWTRLAGWT